VSQDDDTQIRPAATVSGANVASPGLGTATDPKAAAQAAGPAPSRSAAAAAPAPHEQSLAERPEVLAGAAFAGAFVVARILKSIFD
jgi:hypothetical protein